MFLVIFEIHILGFNITRHRELGTIISEDYENMANVFIGSIERSLQRGNRWTTRASQRV